MFDIVLIDHTPYLNQMIYFVTFIVISSSSNLTVLFLGWVAFLLINAIFTVQIELKLELALSL